jgi:tetratricopeptide (TPR) repeat protein
VISRSSAKRPARAPLVGALLAVCSLVATTARADGGTVWQRARRPDAERRQELVAEAEGLERRARKMIGSGREDTSLVELQLARAAVLLQEAGAASSSDLFLRYKLATVYALEDLPAQAAPLLESILRADPPAPLASAVHGELAIAYAHLGRTDEEIAMYGKALGLQPIASERARLLANRAEAHMLLGDVSAAVDGYRAALALLSADHMVFGSGPTTLWGLGAALDRSGDLDAGLDAIRVARIYDPRDRNITGRGWFWVPPYDQHWYAALGHWQVARKPDVVTSVRVDAYGRAVAAWEEYVTAATAAAPDDKWIPLAHVRLKQCDKERAAFLKRPKSPAEPAPPRAVLVRRPKGIVP